MTYSVNGSNAAKNTVVTFTKAGTYSFLVTIIDQIGQTITSGITVTVNQTTTTVAINPAAAWVLAGQTQQFTVAVKDQFGNAMASPPTFAWSMASGGGTINSSGLYTAPGTLGAAVVQAVGGGSTCTANVAILFAGNLFTNSGDIGAFTPAGSSVYGNGTYTILGAGADVWGTADQCQYDYKAVTGDVTIITRVTGVQNTNGWAKAGVMIRETTAAGSANVFLALSPGNGVTLQRRAATGGTSASEYVAGLTAPYWIKLVRSGNDFSGYRSPDGITWTQVGATQTIAMASTVDVGLAVTSHAAGTLCTGTFDRVSISSAVQNAPSNLTATTASDVQINLTWTDNSPDETGFVIDQATDSAFTLNLATNSVGANVTSYNATGLTPGTTYYLRVRARNSTYSNTSSATTMTPLVNMAFGGFASASAEKATESASNAFDGLTSTKWFDNGLGAAGWLQYDLGGGVSRKVIRYDISSANDVPARDPKDWQFQASNNGTTWITLDTRTGETFSARLQTKQYAVANTTGYRYYRLNITANNGDANSLQVSELALMAQNFTPTVAVPALATPNPVTGMTTNVSVLGADDGGEANLIYTWSATGTPPAPVTFSANGTNAAKNAVATFTKAGTYGLLVMISDSGGLTVTSSVSVTVTSAMAGRYLFYSGSFFDSANHNTAIATDKSALLPGHAAGFANYSSYDLGINGLMIDIVGPAATLVPSDFVFAAGNDDSPDGWPTLAVSPTVNNRPGAGVGGSTRVELVLPNNAVQNQWLKVTVKGGAGANSGLTADDVFYFGNAIGETGNEAASMRVDVADQLNVRAAQTASALITSACDINRDGQVDSSDETICRTHMTWFMSDLRLISPPAISGAALPAAALAVVVTESPAALVVVMRSSAALAVASPLGTPAASSAVAPATVAASIVAPLGENKSAVRVTPLAGLVHVATARKVAAIHAKQILWMRLQVLPWDALRLQTPVPGGAFVIPTGTVARSAVAAAVSPLMDAGNRTSDRENK